MEKQSQIGKSLKVLQGNAAIDWFENQIVTRLDIVLYSQSDPRAGAISEVLYIMCRRCTDRILKEDEIERIIRELGRCMRDGSGALTSLQVQRMVGAVLRPFGISSESDCIRIAILAMYSIGESQKSIAKRLGNCSTNVMTVLRNAISTVTPSIDAVNLGKAVSDLIINKMSDAKMEMIYYLAHNKKQAQIARILGMSPQAISKALRTIPKAYRFDLLA
jgi:transcriptional regulator